MTLKCKKLVLCDIKQLVGGTPTWALHPVGEIPIHFRDLPRIRIDYLKPYMSSG